jgi:hypothetical protein
LDWIEKIRRCFETDSVFYTGHAIYEMRNEELGQIIDKEVYEVICSGEVIEKYLYDKPHPSVLIFGKTAGGQPLHVVCAHNKEENLVIVITAYCPHPDLWVDYRRRRQ